MSTSPNGRDRKPLIAGVLVTAALAVVAWNVMHFGSGRRKAPREAARVQAYPVAPVDLQDMLRRTESAPLQGLTTASSGGEAWPALERDPFVGRRAPRASAPAPGTAAAQAPPSASVPVCQAVMLGGAAPAALVDGRSVRVGEAVRGLTVRSIGVRGVVLSGAAGELFLPVGGAAAPDGRTMIQQGESGAAAGGGLVEYVKQERNLP
jgi:hypothetical protein